MRAVDIIEKKKHGEILTSEEIDYMVQGYTKDDIPDYQMSAFLMAIYFKGMNKEETSNLTISFVNSGSFSIASSISTFSSKLRLCCSPVVPPTRTEFTPLSCNNLMWSIVLEVSRTSRRPKAVGTATCIFSFSIKETSSFDSIEISEYILKE